MTTIFISIICSVISAFAVHFLAINRMAKNETIKFRLNAYNDFIGSSSKLIVSRRLGNTKNDINDLTLLNDAKNRIMLCAKHEIVGELITFWEEGSTLEGELELLSYYRLIQLIRQELGFKPNDLHGLKVTGALFKLEPSKFSFRANQTANKPIKQD